ncbi:hypothetical protein RN001_013206 [Aquatica leii]|uniref:Uncharacterized protein n=1 Tax=Aquatica leii TaxID=1421715 RepID=A0AAN7P430_9COLE|nr:hypothetical protein RN001_013206 [Aquatica leii]
MANEIEIKKKSRNALRTSFTKAAKELEALFSVDKLDRESIEVAWELLLSKYDDLKIVDNEIYELLLEGATEAKLETDVEGRDTYFKRFTELKVKYNRLSEDSATEGTGSLRTGTYRSNVRETTDRADPKVQMKQCELPSTSITYNNSFIPSISMSTSNVADSEIDEVTMTIRMLLNGIVNRVTKPKAIILSVHIVSPLPKAGPRKTNGKSRLSKSRIYTGTPEKERIQELETMRKQKLKRKNTKRNILQSGGEVNKNDTKVREKGKGKAPKKKLKKIESDFSDSDVDLPQNIVHETKFFDDLFDSLDEFQDNDVPMLLADDVINCNDYLFVKFPTNKRALHYIGRMESCNIDGSYTVIFLRKCKSGFRFSDLQDISTVSREDIVSTIPNLVEAPGTSRCDRS